MGIPVKYGRQLTLTREGDVLTATEETFRRFERVHTAMVVTETVYIDDPKDMLAHFLTMMDEQKAGTIDCIGIQMIRNQDGSAMRIEKTWVPTLLP